MRWVLRSKIHNATVTDTNIDYIGSLTVDIDLIEQAGFWPGEEVLVVSNTTGVRLETYLISGERNSGVIAANGAAAHLLKAGDQVIIMGFELSDQPIQPKIVLVDKKNHFMRYRP
jgi:aspartate 1-decarboxylase